jgi:hypothetical protein
MSSPTPLGPSPRAYTIWPSLILAAIFAFLVPTWIDYADRLRTWLFNFHPLVLVLCVPLAFGLFWPVFVALHASAVPSLPVVRPLRVKVAKVLFTIGMLLSAPCVFFEFQSLKGLKAARDAEGQRRAEAAAQEQAKQSFASSQVLSTGILLRAAHSGAIPSARQLLPLSFSPASGMPPGRPALSHSLAVLIHLAGNKTCSPDALQALYEDALVLKSQETHPAYPAVYFPVHRDSRQSQRFS